MVYLSSFRLTHLFRKIVSFFKGNQTLTIKTKMDESFISDSEDTSDSEESEEVETDVIVSEPFIERGDCSDEIVLNFDNGKKLFVSENFLSYASPVFQAMFRHNFREKTTREVALKEKLFEDFHEFLLCLHPGVQKPVDKDNVLRIVSFAEEYQVHVTVRKCQEVMTDWLTDETGSARRDSSKIDQSAAICLNILSEAVHCGFGKVTSHAIRSVARFGPQIFTGITYANTRTSQTKSHANKVCIGLYRRLPEELKTRLLLERLKLCDDGKMR